MKPDQAAQLEALGFIWDAKAAQFDDTMNELRRLIDKVNSSLANLERVTNISE